MYKKLTLHFSDFTVMVSFQVKKNGFTASDVSDEHLVVPPLLVYKANDCILKLITWMSSADVLTN